MGWFKSCIGPWRDSHSSSRDWCEAAGLNARELVLQVAGSPLHCRSRGVHFYQNMGEVAEVSRLLKRGFSFSIMFQIFDKKNRSHYKNLGGENEFVKITYHLRDETLLTFGGLSFKSIFQA